MYFIPVFICRVLKVFLRPIGVEGSRRKRHEKVWWYLHGD
jgi:hypothetical protein